MNQPKIFSLNKIAYLKSKGIEEEYIGKDPETGNIYYCFPVCQEVEQTLKKYKQDEELHKFISAFKNVKKEIFKRRREN